jgi:fatty acid desaturase
MSQSGRDLDRMKKSLSSSGSDLDRKYWIALALYAILAALAWFTLGEGTIFVSGKPVQLRFLPLVIIGGLVLRTVLAHQADRIRRGGDGDGDSTPR